MGKVLLYIVEIMREEKQNPALLFPGKSLAEKFEMWSREKQEAYLVSFSVFQAHSLSLSGIVVSPEEILSATRQKL